MHASGMPYDVLIIGMCHEISKIFLANFTTVSSRFISTINFDIKYLLICIYGFYCGQVFAAMWVARKNINQKILI